MIEIQNLCKSYGMNVILDNVNLVIDEGDFFGLIGKSGSGKSTLLRCMNGLEKISSGEVLINGTNIRNLSEKQLNAVRKNIGMVFQGFSLMQRLSVFDNIALPMRVWKMSDDAINEKVRYLLNVVNLSDKREHFPKQLSGGQKQRVAIARALALESSILLCDEPTSALDPENEASILELLVDLNKSLGITIVMVSHQMDVIRRTCNSFSVVKNKSVSRSYPTSELGLAELS